MSKKQEIFYRVRRIEGEWFVLQYVRDKQKMLTPFGSNLGPFSHYHTATEVAQSECDQNIDTMTLDQIIPYAEVEIINGSRV